MARVRLEINSLGFRGDELTRRKPANTVRIACLGASTTFNAEVSSNHATWPHRLQEHLRLAILARSRSDAGQPLDAIPADLPARFTSVLEEMRRELAERDVPLVLSTFLVKYRRDQDRSTQIANADVEFYYMPWMSIEGMLDAVDRYNAAIIEFATGHGLPVVDDRQAIPADAEHFGAAGRRLGPYFTLTDGELEQTAVPARQTR